MVELNEKEIVITIPHPSPADYLRGLQLGVIEMVKSLLSVGPPLKELVMDSETSEGCICALELVQATMIDPSVLELASEIADQVTNLKGTVSEIRKDLLSSFPDDTTQAKTPSNEEE
jgi:hypothetical protein